MKKTSVLILSVLFMGAFIYAQTKVGVINPDEVILKTIRGKQVKQKLEKLAKGFQQKTIKKENEIKKLEKDLVSPALNSETRERKSLELQNKKTNLKRFAEDSRKEWQAQWGKEMRKLTNEIMPIIKKIGKSKNYTLIFDYKNSGISYFDKTVDITNEVIRDYNLKYSKKNK